MIDPKDFQKYATKHMGINSLVLDKYTAISSSYISPTIIEERQLNVASMDVFSRLMMDRIIFLGVPIDDYVANIIQAQLLYLDSVDSTKDISMTIKVHGRASKITSVTMPAYGLPSTQRPLFNWK